jgi:hypothetical protein
MHDESSPLNTIVVNHVGDNQKRHKSRKYTKVISKSKQLIGKEKGKCRSKATQQTKASVYKGKNFVVSPPPRS